MAIKSSLCVALACMGLGPVAAGVVFHAKSVSRAAAIEAHATPWGALSPVAVPTGGAVLAAGAPEDLRKHLRLAPQDATDDRPAAEPSDAGSSRERPETASDTSTVKVSAPEATDGPATMPGEPRFATDQAAPPIAPMREAVLATGGPATVAVDPTFNQPTPVAEVPRDEPVGSGAALDLNTASMAALNHIPGMSNIGRAIVSHRPYRSVEDLVSRHVLRSGDFRRVRDKVKV